MTLALWALISSWPHDLSALTPTAQSESFSTSLLWKSFLCQTPTQALILLKVGYPSSGTAVQVLVGGVWLTGAGAVLPGTLSLCNAARQGYFPHKLGRLSTLVRTPRNMWRHTLEDLYKAKYNNTGTSSSLGLSSYNPSNIKFIPPAAGFQLRRPWLASYCTSSGLQFWSGVGNILCPNVLPREVVLVKG